MIIMITDDVKSTINFVLDNPNVENFVTPESKRQIQIWMDEKTPYVRQFEKDSYIKIKWLTENGIKILNDVNKNIDSRL